MNGSSDYHWNYTDVEVSNVNLDGYWTEGTASGYAVVRGDGSYAEFEYEWEAEEAAELLAKGEKDDSHYEWTD